MGVVAWFVDTGGRFTGRSSVDVGAKLRVGFVGDHFRYRFDGLPLGGVGRLDVVLRHAVPPFLRCSPFYVAANVTTPEGVCQQHLAVHAGVSTEPHLAGIGVGSFCLCMNTPLTRRMV